jgi:hypothetical protein
MQLSRLTAKEIIAILLNEVFYFVRATATRFTKTKMVNASPSLFIHGNKILHNTIE